MTAEYAPTHRCASGGYVTSLEPNKTSYVTTCMPDKLFWVEKLSFIYMILESCRLSCLDCITLCCHITSILFRSAFLCRMAHLGYTAKRNMRSESAQQLWAETSVAVVLISLAPFLLLCLMPDLAKRQSLLKIFLAFAAGGLLGDAFLHLIPHAIDRHHEGPEEHDHKQHMIVGISIVSGIFLFLCIEKLIRVFQRGPGHSHSHTTTQPVQNSTKPLTSEAPQKNKKAKKGNSGGGDDAHGKQTQQQQQHAHPQPTHTKKSISISTCLFKKSNSAWVPRSGVFIFYFTHLSPDPAKPASLFRAPYDDRAVIFLLPMTTRS
ncbi:unnamed protein product [Echinostoma caproni]|uniref:Zinc transporter ZIP10 n=1 Tax=Echinostoma caproni TaxID=27848 RepID=A0A183BDD5_9TREM|nr:unnamed protein product [Echinostoma caproni]